MKLFSTVTKAKPLKPQTILVENSVADRFTNMFTLQCIDQYNQNNSIPQTGKCTTFRYLKTDRCQQLLQFLSFPLQSSYVRMQQRTSQVLIALY